MSLVRSGLALQFLAQGHQTGIGQPPGLPVASPWDRLEKAFRSQGSGISKNMNFGPDAGSLPTLLPSCPECDRDLAMVWLHSGFSGQAGKRHLLASAPSRVPEEPVSSSPGPAAATCARRKEARLLRESAKVQEERGMLSADGHSQ